MYCTTCGICVELMCSKSKPKPSRFALRTLATRCWICRPRSVALPSQSQAAPSVCSTRTPCAWALSSRKGSTKPCITIVVTVSIGQSNQYDGPLAYPSRKATTSGAAAAPARWSTVEAPAARLAQARALSTIGPIWRPGCVGTDRGS